MKKTLTLAILLFSSIAYAQIDLAVTSIDEPTFLKDNADGLETDFPLQFTMTNNGDALSTGDTLTYVFALINRETNSFLLTPAAGPLLILNQDVPSGQSITSPLIPLVINTTLGRNTEVSVAISAYVFNRTTNPVDADSTDNTFLKEMIWEKQYGASVVSTEFNDNVATFPNPAVDVLNVELAIAKSNEVKIELMDLTGKVVTSEGDISSLNANSYQVDVTDLEKGVYIVKITNGDVITTSKVSVSH